MNYIYNIYINLNQNYYDVYEWLKKDKIIYIKKIPIFRIQTKDLKKLIKDKIQIDNNLVNDIKNHCETTNKRSELIICCFTDTKDEIVVQIDDKGNIIKKSSIHFTDKFNNFLALEQLNLINFNYKIVSQLPINLTNRNEEERKQFLIKQINKLDDNKLIYLYFECFNQKVDKKMEIRTQLKKEIIHGNENINSIIENFFKLIYVH